MPAREINESLLRIVILDYPKLLLEDSTAYSIFGDMIKCRQRNFLRTSESFLVMDKHDLIGTHVLIYDFSNPFDQKLVAGVRISYESRAREHDLAMPMESVLSFCPPEARHEYEAFKREKGPSIQLNTLFVNPEYSLSQSGLRLSEILFFGLCTYIRRLGQDHFVTAPNDRLKTDRWVKLSGSSNRPTFTFNHPEVNAQHTLYFINAINENWLANCVKDFRHYWTTSFEIVPDQVKLRTTRELFAGIAPAADANVAPLKRTS